MYVDKSRTPKFGGVQFLNDVADVASNSIVKAFEKNKEYDLFLRKTESLTEWKLKRVNNDCENIWIVICEKAKLIPETIQRYMELFRKLK